MEMRCPNCPEVLLGDDGTCRTCHGAWLDKHHLEEMAARPLEYTGGTLSERRCPACDELMDSLLIFDVPIDTCPKDGMWFAKADLDEVLHRSRSDEWRLYGGVRGVGAASTNVIGSLIEVVRIWRRKRKP
jgi:Zn-finger nucleic acid-binding protein